MIFFFYTGVFVPHVYSCIHTFRYNPPCHYVFGSTVRINNACNRHHLDTECGYGIFLDFHDFLSKN